MIVNQNVFLYVEVGEASPKEREVHYGLCYCCIHYSCGDYTYRNTLIFAIYGP